jgi:hypothetical protein
LKTTRRFSSPTCHPKFEVAHKVFVTVGIAVRADNPREFTELKSWAICPADTSIDRCFITRESQSGTLVIAVGRRMMVVVWWRTLLSHTGFLPSQMGFLPPWSRFRNLGEWDISITGLAHITGNLDVYQGYMKDMSFFAW